MRSNKSSSKLKYSFQAIGTQWSITGDINNGLYAKITQRIEQFDRVYSRFIDSSTMRSISGSVGKHTLPKDAEPLFDFYQKLYDISNGLVTPLIGHTMEQAGYDASYSFKSGVLTQPPIWNEAIKYDFPNITIKIPLVFDFGAAGKGYLVDIISKLIQENGIDNFCVNAGGDIFTKGTPQIIGLENPIDTSEIVGTVSIKNSAICASSGNRRQWGKFHHTINPKTLQSPKNVDAIWVRANTTMIADGIATALYFVDPVKLRKHFDFEYALIQGKDMHFSSGFGVDTSYQ